MQQQGQTTRERPVEAPATEQYTGNGRKLSRLHLQKHLPDYGLVINCFADTAAELWFLYREILQMIEDNDADALAKAKRSGIAYVQSDAKVESKPLDRQPHPQPKPQPKPSRGNGGGISNAPLCEECGKPCTLIRWADKKTGEAKRAWKCEPCDLWVRS